MTEVARMFHVLCSPLSLPAGAIDGSDQAARSNGICLVLICLEERMQEAQAWAGTGWACHVMPALVPSEQA